jgi:hypothetical protein
MSLSPRTSERVPLPEQADIEFDTDNDEPHEITDARPGEHGNLEFKLLWTSGDTTWHPQHDLMGLKHLVREFYDREPVKHGKVTTDPNLKMPVEFSEGRGEIDKDASQVTQTTEANIRLTLQHNGIREEDPQYYDSEKEYDSEELDETQDPVQDEQATQVPPPDKSNFDQYNECALGIQTSNNDVKEMLKGTNITSFAEHLLRSTCTLSLSNNIQNALIDVLPRLKSIQLISRLRRDQVGHAEKGLILLIWLIVCLKAHNRIQPTVYKLPHKICSVLRRTGVDLAHDPAQGKTSKQYIESSLTYWEKRLRQAYSVYQDTSRNVQWGKVSWWSEINFQSMLFDVPNDSIRNALSTSWKLCGLSEMTKTCLRLELDTGHSPLNAAVRQNRKEITTLIRQMLGTMPKTVLRACVLGKLAAWYEVPDSPVRKEMDLIANLGDTAPGTYANFFTDKSGMALTPAQLETVVSGIKRYLNPHPSRDDSEWAYMIDRLHWPKRNWTRQHTQNGLRRYTDWRAQDRRYPYRQFQKNGRRRAILNHFVAEMERFIAKSTARNHFHTPCARPLSEVGYAKCPTSRLQQHYKHTNSNYIMNLFHAIMLDCFGQDFRLQQLTIYSCWNPSDAWLSEIIFTRILQAYTIGGKGMSHYQAGLSNWSAYRKVGEEVWEAVMYEKNVVQRLEQSFANEIQELKTHEAELEKENAKAREELGPLTTFTRGTKRQHLVELCDLIAQCYGKVRDGDEDEEEDDEDEHDGGESDDEVEEEEEEEGGDEDGEE